MKPDADEGDAHERLPLLRVRAADVASRILVVGDPARAEDAAALLENVRRVGANREYVTYTGNAGGRRVRAGICGAVQDAIADGERVIASAAVRDEGLTPRLLPLGYPAAAHHRVVAALEDAAREAQAEAHTGVVLATDLFYPSAALGVDWELWQKSGVLAVEMEASALFIVAALHGLEAGAVFTVDGNPTRAAEDMSEYDPYRPVVAEGKKKMLRVALAALTRLD